MEKKQIIVKLLCIILLLAITVFFVFFSGNFFTGDNKPIVEEVKPDKPNNDDTPQNIPQNIYSTLPKNASNYKTNSKIINIGGLNNDRLLKHFVIDKEIFCLIQTNSNNYDMKATKNMLAIAKLDNNLTLQNVYMLEETTNKNFVDSVVFLEGFCLLLTDDEASYIFYYNSEYKLTEKLTLEKIDEGKLIVKSNYIKLISFGKDSLCYRQITDNFLITSFAKINCSNIKLFNSTISLHNKDIFFVQNNDSFIIFEATLKQENDKTYYVINQIKQINGLLCEIKQNNKNNEIVLLYSYQNKILASTLDIISLKISSFDLEIMSDNASIIVLDNGYILHTFMDNKLYILDNNFNKILSDICTYNQKLKIIKSYYNHTSKNYYFVADLVDQNNTVLYKLSPTLAISNIITLPKINGQFNQCFIDDICYLFIDTNNNINDFQICYGGYDTFVIKLNEIQ